ncbi:MAG: O-antigen ligase family protein [Elusimicrobia bacterium]|nr:O-antigen ligase family protein [Elusimicrobiota bacterium]
MKVLFFLCVGIHALAPLIFLTHFTQNPYSIQIVFLQSGLLVAGGLLGVHLWRSRPLSVVGTALDFPLILFGFWALATLGISFWTHGPFFRPGIFHEGVRGILFLWVNALGAFFISTQFPKGPQSLVLRKVMIAVGGIAAVYGLIQYFGIDPLWGKSVNAFAGRPVSTYGNPNFLSSVLVLLLPLLLHQFLIAPSTVQAWGWASTGVIYTAALTCTMTRSSWIGAGIALTLYVCLDWKTLSRTFKRGAIWIGAVFSVILFWPASTLGSSVPWARMLDLWRGITGNVVYASWHQRLLIWRSAWDMWTESPWVGKGWGLFELFFPYYQGRLIPLDLFRTFRTHANNAHQLFLEIGSQTGLIGLGLLFWICTLTAVSHLKTRHRLSADERSLAAALLAGVGGMAADNALGNVSLFFAVPGFLFFWVWGQWASLCTGKTLTFRPFPPLLRRLGAVFVIGICIFGIKTLLQNVLGEAAFLKDPNSLSTRTIAREEGFLRAKQFKRYDVNINFELGNLYLRRAETARAQGFQEEVQANAEKAVECYTDALHSNPSYDELFESRARALRILQREEESELDLRMAILLNPLRKESVLALENQFAKKNKADPRRIECLERAVEIFPEDLLFRLHLAEGLEKAERFSEAGKVYEGVLARELDHAEAWAGIQRVEPLLPANIIEGKKLLFAIREDARASRWNDAYTRAERLIVLFPEDPLPRLMAADMAAQLGNDMSAVVRYKEFLQKKPDHPEARKNLSIVEERLTLHGTGIDGGHALR